MGKEASCNWWKIWLSSLDKYVLVKMVVNNFNMDCNQVTLHFNHLCKFLKLKQLFFWNLLDWVCHWWICLHCGGHNCSSHSFGFSKCPSCGWSLTKNHWDNGQETEMEWTEEEGIEKAPGFIVRKLRIIFPIRYLTLVENLNNLLKGCMMVHVSVQSKGGSFAKPWLGHSVH